MNKTSYVEHLTNIGRKYFTRPNETESPTTEMTQNEKCVLAGLLFEDFLLLNDDVLKNLLVKLMTSGEVEDERALIEYLKNRIVHFYKLDIENLIREKD